MRKEYLIAGLFLTFVIVILGCAQKEQKITEKPAILNAEKSQESPKNIKENLSSINQQNFNEISDTEALDSALKELDSVE